MADYPISGEIAVAHHIDRGTILVTATPVAVPGVGMVYATKHYASQAGCLRAIAARSETAIQVGDAPLEVGMSINGTPLAGANVTYAAGGLHKEGTFKNGAYPFAEGDEVGCYIMQTGTITAGQFPNEVDVLMTLQYGKSNI